MVEGGRRRVVARLALLAALVLAVGVVFAMVEVGVSLRWIAGGGGDGGGDSSIFFLSANNRPDKAVKTNSGNGAGEDSGGAPSAFSDEVDLEPPDAPWTGAGERAYAVVFPDVQDPLVLERALGLWGALEALKGDGEDVVAIVPRFCGQQLLAPLVDMGYRVLPRESPAPPWRATGRFLQQTLTAIGPGWGSGEDGSGGGGGGGGQGWSLLALEALALTEYKEVVVLDQKMVIFPPVEPTQGTRNSNRRGTRRAAEVAAAAVVAVAISSGHEGSEAGQGAAGAGGAKREGGRGRLLGGEEEGGVDGGDGEGTEPGDARRTTSAAATAEAAAVGANGRRLPPLVPPKGDWAVAFAEGADSALAHGPGLRSLKQGQQDRFGGQHPALMVVLPDIHLYWRISELLCEEDKLFSEVFPGMSAEGYAARLARDKVWERRAPTVPLLHLAVGMTSDSGVPAKLPLEVCGGGGSDELAGEIGGGEEGGGTAWRWTGATSPVVWCPASPPQSQGSGKRPKQQQRRRRRRRLGDPAIKTVADSASSGEVESMADKIVAERGWSDGGGDTFGATESAGFEREGHRNVLKMLEGGVSATDNGGGAAAAGMPEERDDGRRSPPGLEPGGVRSGSRGSSRVDQTGVADEGGRGVESIERRLAEQREDGGQDEAELNKEAEQEEQEEEGRKKENPENGGRSKGQDQEQGEEEDEDDEEGKGEGEGGGDTQSRAGAIRLAWIPGDPCSCASAPGLVGEACRGWLMARAQANSSPSRGSQSSDAESQQDGGGRQEMERDLLVLALSACEDGELASPLQLPPPPAQQAARAAATAGAAYSAHQQRPPGRDDGADGDSVGVPPPLWQESKPKIKPVVTPLDMKAFQHHWLANVEKKLLMLAIPKVACTQVHALFLRMQGSQNWNSPHMHEIHYHQDMDKYKVKTMPNMTPERVSSILTDPTWTKAVFLRDPAERLLSCFLDKIVHRKSYSVSVFQADNILSFERFVALTSKDAQAKFQKDYPGGNLGLSRNSNPHWKPQLYFGLDKFLPYFDFVGDFKHVGAHSEALLKRAGLWDEFGASGWGPGGKAAFFQRSTVQGHATGSHDSKSQYYTPPLLASVREAYAPTDYRMLAGIGWWNETSRAW